MLFAVMIHTNNQLFLSTMRTLVNLCLAGAVALTLVSCACPRCGGLGTEVAMTSGVHPYTKAKYKRNQVIPCLGCGGMKHSGANPGASVYSSGQAIDAAYREKKPTKGATIHVHRHYNTYHRNYIVY